MVHAQTTELVNMISPKTLASTATQTATLDTLGFDYAQVRMSWGADTAAATVVKLGEDETTVITNMTDIAAFLGATAFTIPDSSTSAKVVIFNIDLRKRKRYLHLTFRTADAVGRQSADATLSRAHTIPGTASERGGDINIIG